MKSPKVDNSGQEAALAAQAKAQEAANNLSKNFSTNLQNENLATVVPGGSAAAADAAGIGSQRKRKMGTGLSSQLGIDV